MKVLLLHPDHGADLTVLDSSVQADLERDLDLATVLSVMAQGDAFKFDVARSTLLRPLQDPEHVLWRQRVFEDALLHPAELQELYDLALVAVAAPRHLRGWNWGDYPSAVLGRSIDLLEVLMPSLRDLRQWAQENRSLFTSPGLDALVREIEENLTDEYFAQLEEQLVRLRFPTGVVLTADVGPGAKGTAYVLRRPESVHTSWRDWLLGLPHPGELVYRLPDRDEAGARSLGELRDVGTALVAEALAQATDHILAYVNQLRWQVAFYLGCLHLHDALLSKRGATCLPRPAPMDEPTMQLRGLYDASLALRSETPVVPNDLDVDTHHTVLITGTNQGGKTTFLRAIGIAQLMMQSGMFVAAADAALSLSPGVHTHFHRDEDTTMTSGKLDSELTRMSEIVDRLRPRDLVLFNESFASTNEREGSMIAAAIIDGLEEAQVRVVFVTHLYELAHGLEDPPGRTLFLTPERLEDGTRTFRITTGRPERTSHAEDRYDAIFASSTT